MSGSATDVEVAALLTALHIKGETCDELAGAVDAVRERMIRFESIPPNGRLLDTCGTGGDRASTVNISTAAAIVVAACGVNVAKHGNRSATGVSGSAEVLGALGVAVETEAGIATRCLSELGIVFLLAPKFHPGLAPVAPIRRRLPFRTVFNLIGPLCNPACPALQLVGVPSDVHAELVAEVLARQPHIERACVVSGEDGLDEVTLGTATRVRAVIGKEIRHEIWQPADFGLDRHSAETIKISDAQSSARAIEATFEGRKGPVRDYILANAAAALWLVGPDSLRELTARAAAAIDSGAAMSLLERWRQIAPASGARSAKS
jgi:anthranilate phosphoribosyltransferase